MMNNSLDNQLNNLSNSIPLPINAEYELKKQLEEEIKKINNLVEKINHLSKIQKENINYSQYFQKIIFPNE